MLKATCRQPFFVQHSQWFNVNTKKSLVIELHGLKNFCNQVMTAGRHVNVNNGRRKTSWNPLLEVFSTQGMFVNYSRDSRVACDSLMRHGSAFKMKLSVTQNQNELAQEKDCAHVDSSWKQVMQCYLKLSKIRLSGLVVLTCMAGYSVAPGELSTVTFLFASLGTMLCSCSANTVNQCLEIPFDSQMSRTKNRVLVRGLLSPFHALSVGVVAGVSGLALLVTQVNGLTALLGVTNMFVYSLVYTPLKRLSIINTWLGSLVGALPPLMGWAACTSTLDPGAFILGAILYSWQFPHFNALSWNLRPDYSRAGYRMMSVLNPELCRKVAMRHSVSLLCLSTLLPAFDVTSWWLALDSLPLNVCIVWLAWKFNRDSDNKAARNLFRFSLLHLPLLMSLILFHKSSRQPKERTQDGGPGVP